MGTKNEEAGAGNARIKREGGGEFIYFLLPFFLSHSRSSAPYRCNLRPPRFAYSVSRSYSSAAMAQHAGNVVLPSSHITEERHLSLIRKIMPDGAVAMAGEPQPRPRYLDQSVHLLPFAMAGLIPPFSRFFYKVLM